jgi:hypothetical protein
VHDVSHLCCAVKPEEKVTLTAAMMFFLGRAFADWLAEQLGKPAAELHVAVRHRMLWEYLTGDISASLAGVGRGALAAITYWNAAVLRPRRWGMTHGCPARGLQPRWLLAWRAQARQLLTSASPRRPQCS